VKEGLILEGVMVLKNPPMPPLGRRDSSLLSAMAKGGCFDHDPHKSWLLQSFVLNIEF
jgi:hypothetical protein